MAKTWKEYILRSGAPLEYEVARAVSNVGFEVDADFSYLRRDVQGTKELSVDIFATHWSEKEDLEFAAHLLIECKYRSPGKCLLLLPEPNVWVRPSTLGGTVMSLDQFVPYHLALNAFLELEAGCAVVYKGVEIYEKDSAVDAEFRRAIQQLRYGMPAALHRAIDLCMFGGHDTMHAIFLAPVLVTNAPLLVLKEDVDMHNIEEAQELSAITDEVGMAVLYSEYGPDYVQHFHGSMEKLVIGNDEMIKDLERRIRKKGKRFAAWEGPVQTIADLRGDDIAWCRESGTQFYIVSRSHLETFLEQFMTGCRNAYDMRSKRKAKTVATLRDFLPVDRQVGPSDDAEVQSSGEQSSE